MKTKILLFIILIPLGAFAQKRTKGIVIYEDELGQFVSYASNIKIYYDLDSVNFTTTNNFGEYKIKSFCDTCLLYFETADPCSLTDSIIVKYNTQPSKRKLNFKIPLCYHFDIFTCRYLRVGYIFKSAYTPHGFTFYSNQGLFGFRKCSNLTYGLSYSSNFNTNNIYSFDSKLNIASDFYTRAISVEFDYYDIKSLEFELLNICFDYSSNYKFLYYSVGAGIYQFDKNSPFIRAGIEIPFKPFRSRFYLDTDINNIHVNYKLGIYSSLNRFKTKIGYHSLFDFKVLEIGLAYNILY